MTRNPLDITHLWLTREELDALRETVVTSPRYLRERKGEGPVTRVLNIMDLAIKRLDREA